MSSSLDDSDVMNPLQTLLDCLLNLLHCCCPCFFDTTEDENKSLLKDAADAGYDTISPSDNDGSPKPGAESRNGGQDRHAYGNPLILYQSVKIPETPERAVEKIALTPLNLSKADEIFQQFQNTFNTFADRQSDLQTGVEQFKTAVQSTGEFRASVSKFKEQLPDGERVVKKLTIRISKAVIKAGGTVGDGATALNSIFKAYDDMEKQLFKVNKIALKSLKEAMEIDLSDISGLHQGGGVSNLTKMPKRIDDMRNNMKEIQKAPKIVRSFFEYATSIVLDVIKEFDDNQSEQLLANRLNKVDNDTKKTNEEIEKIVNPKPPKEIQFASLDIPTIDEIFRDIAQQVNPVIELSQDLFDARTRLERALKAISEFRNDPSKAFHDYLEELKKRIREGHIHIAITLDGTHVESVKLEGLEPKVMQDLESGFESVIKSGDELLDLIPDTIKKLIDLIEDITKVSKSDIRRHVELKDVPSTFSRLRENAKKAKTIPDSLEFFVRFVQNLIMDILQVLHTAKEDLEKEN